MTVDRGKLIRAEAQILHRIQRVIQLLDGARAGKTVDQLKQELKLEKYAAWDNFESYRPLNIEGMYKLVQANRRNNQNVLGGKI